MHINKTPHPYRNSRQTDRLRDSKVAPDVPVDTFESGSSTRAVLEEVGFMSLLGTAAAAFVPELLEPSGDIALMAARAVVGGLLGGGLAACFPWTES